MSQSRRHRQDPWLSGSIDTWDVSWRSDGDFISSDRSVLFFLPSPIAKGPPQPQGSRQVGANHSQQLGLVDRLLEKSDRTQVEGTSFIARRIAT
jgi:hypothetical protein